MIRVVLPNLRGPESTLGDRNFIDAVLFRLKTGVPWRDLPDRFGKWKTIYTRFNRWSHKGHWELIFEELQLDFDEEGVLIDASIVRAHQDAAGGKGGSSGMHWVVLEVGSPRRSTRSSTRGGGRSTSKSRQGSSTSPPSRKQSSTNTRAARRS
jgi:putative transposase